MFNLKCGYLKSIHVESIEEIPCLRDIKERKKKKLTYKVSSAGN